MFDIKAVPRLSEEEFDKLTDRQLAGLEFGKRTIER